MWAQRLTLLLFLLCLSSTQALHIQPRQDAASSTAPLPSTTQPPAPASTDPGSATSSVQPSSNAVSGSSSDAPASVTTAPPSSSSPSLSTLVFSTATSTSSPMPSGTGLSSSNGTTEGPAPGQLPLQPVISPAFAVAGVLLMANGIALGFIGYQRKWIYIPGAVAALISVSILILELYVVNPPVSNGVQGGYLVAAVLPPYLVGAAAFYIFSEIVEGFACIAGGFSFAMWLLCLSPGGLVQSTGGRAGLIAAFCVAMYAGYFSKWTRTYAMIGSLAFTGSTMLVLGIDCFSKAGLKEFWVYNWDLNSNLFPLGTNTYPATRGIKVEEAIIVVLSIVGVVSQLKLWNIIKKRRDEKAQARLQDEEDREHLEADLGRQVEEHNRSEKPKWEAVYGDRAGTSSASIFQSATDSHYDLTGRSKNGSVVEMAELSSEMTPRSEKRDSKGYMTAREAGDNERRIHHERKNTLDALDPEGNSRERKASVVETINNIVEDMDGKRIVQEPAQLHVQALPFKIPSPGETHDRDDANSLTTAAGGDVLDDEFQPQPLAPARKAHEKFNKRSSADAGSVAPDHDFAVPHIEEDRASSVDAVPDDEPSADEADAKTAKRSTTDQADHPQDDPVIARRKSASSLHKSTSRAGLSVPAGEAAEKRKSMPDLEQLEEAQAASPDEALYAKPTTLTDKLQLRTARTSSANGKQAAESAEEPTRRVSLKKEFLPDGHSNIMQIYRTNEWAKHISTAEQPEVDHIEGDSEHAIGVDYGAEKAAPLDPEALLQTAMSGQSNARAPSQASVTNPYTRKAMMRSSSRTDDPPSGRGRRHSREQESSVMDTNVPTSSGSRVSSAAGMYGTPGLARSLSNLHPGQILEESPAEEDRYAAEPTSLSRPASSANNRPAQFSKTLLGLRQKKLDARMSTTSFANDMVDSPSLQRSVSATQIGHSVRASQSSSNIYSNFDEPTSTPPMTTARSSVDIRKTSSPSTAQSTAYGAPRQSARTSMTDLRQRSTSNPSYLSPMDSQRISSDAKRLSIIQDMEDENASLSSRRDTLIQQQAQLVDDDDMPLSQRREMIRRASVNSISRTNSFINMTPGSTSPLDSPGGMVRQRSFTSSPFQHNNPSVIYDSHQPKRGSTFDSAKRESRLAEWRADMHRDASRERISSYNSSTMQDESMGRIMGERRMKAEHDQRMLDEQAARDRNIQEAMRSGAMQQAHRDKLRQMQLGASRAAS